MAIKKVSAAKSKEVSVKKKVAKKAVKKSASTATKKSTPKKAPAKKAAVKKTATKKAPAKKVAVKKTLTKKAPAKKAAVKKVSAKKVAVKKTVKKAASKTRKSAVELLVDAAVEGILKIKGKNISILDLGEIENRVCDYYIICEGTSNTQVNAIADSVEEEVKKKIKENPYQTEGFQNAEWILIDYVSVVVHVFQAETRQFYNLESLWADAKVTRLAFD